MLFRSDRKSTRLNSSHTIISYAVFCLKKKRSWGAARNGGRSWVRRKETYRVALAATSQLPMHPPTREGHVSLCISVPVFFFFLMIRLPPRSTLFPYTPLFRSGDEVVIGPRPERPGGELIAHDGKALDRKSTRLNSSHTIISYAVFCLEKKKVREYEPVVHRLGLSASPYVPTPPGQISLTLEPLVFRWIFFFQ